MKTNYDFPYLFRDWTSTGMCYVESKSQNNQLVITVDLSRYTYHEGIDVVLELETTQTFYRKLFRLSEFRLSESKSEVKINYDDLGSKVDYSILLISKLSGTLKWYDELSDY
jgi:hypothetical protein